MIGNDIVDLKQAATDSDWRRNGYLQKVFTVAEQDLIAKAAAPDVLVWLFWSMKEAAYKIFSRELGLRNFAPYRIECLLKESGSSSIAGEVVYEGRKYQTLSFVNETDHYVHSLAVDEPADFKKVSIEIAIYSQYPDYRRSNPASVSHHGRYLALAFGPLF